MDLHTAPLSKPIPLRDGGGIAGAGPVICAPLVGRSRASLGAEASSLALQQPDLLEKILRVDGRVACGDWARHQGSSTSVIAMGSDRTRAPDSLTG